MARQRGGFPYDTEHLLLNSCHDLWSASQQLYFAVVMMCLPLEFENAIRYCWISLTPSSLHCFRAIALLTNSKVAAIKADGQSTTLTVIQLG